METENRKRHKKRIAHVLKSSIYSGAENVVLTIIRELWDEFDFVYIATDGPIRERLLQEQVPCILLKKFTRGNLAKAVKDWKPDIIHAHDFSASVMCATLTGRFRLISHLHHDPPWVRGWNGKTVVYWGLSHRMEHILAVSESANANFVFTKMIQSKTMIVGNPIDKDRILQMGGLGTEKKYDLLFVGRFVKPKNPQAFIEIVNVLRQEGMMVNAAMLGEGELESECENLIQRYDLQDSIHLLGFQENPYFYMKESRILCMTSRWEGFGLVAAEASIIGTPVLSTKTGGATDIFGDNSVELCTGQSDFVEKIKVLLSDQDVYERWCKRTALRQAQFTDQVVYMENLKSIYKKDKK